MDLNYCNNVSVIHQIPVSINENELFQYNPNSSYHNDRCHLHTTNSKTDITLYNRRNEYNDNNISLCENNCTYKSYDSSTKKVDCECILKLKIPFFEDIYIDKNQLLDKFINIKSVTNIVIIKCYKLLFSKNGFISNIGNYILLSFLFISIIQLFLFYFKGYNLLSNRIKRIIQINFNFNKNIITLNDKHQIKKFNLCNKNEKNKRNQKNKNVFTSLYYPTKKN